MTKVAMPESEVILEVGAEGGSITLYGLRVGSGWRFSREVIDQTPMLLDEPSIEHHARIVSTWSEAVSLLDEYPWHMLFALRVHPEFRGPVFEAVLERSRGGRGPSEGCMERWEEFCRVR